MSLYPDNVNRANRVRQLAQDIAGIQAALRESVEDARIRDADAVYALNLLSEEAGFRKLDDYVTVANQLTVNVEGKLEEFGPPVNPIMLIAEGIQGAHSRTMLQAAIVELCGHRFIMKNMQRQVYAILTFKSNAKSIVQMKFVYDRLINKGSASGEEVAQDMRPEMDKIVADIRSAVHGITSEAIWELLDEQDESRTSWRDEDPNLEKILEWVHDHA
ncbi:hypothetical protein M413DRAFT_449903 [Hebeloma cylindrosporum]|uniref:Uncharacterized protein n=1 Tax=Hebeloma cylindrosporum TaxID=76867 RepID=A0A0C3BUN0_HEBCY|nr:hypothetical protein M413DRAFT_449903 [Hebeloma cylindrosporum h7]